MDNSEQEVVIEKVVLPSIDSLKNLESLELWNLYLKVKAECEYLEKSIINEE